MAQLSHYKITSLTPVTLTTVHRTTPVTASMPMIEKKRVGSSGGAAVLERPAPLIQPGTAAEQPSPADKFKVMLFNDNGNTREYVARSLVQVSNIEVLLFLQVSSAW